MGRKPEPATVKVKPLLPSGMKLGVTEAVAGSGLFTVKVKPLEVPPDDDGLLTVIVFNAPRATSEAVIVACTWLAEMNVVGRLLPLNWTVEADMKFDPFTVSMKSGPPATVELGLKDAIDGVIGGGGGGGGGFEPPPPQPASQLRLHKHNTSATRYHALSAMEDSPLYFRCTDVSLRFEIPG